MPLVVRHGGGHWSNVPFDVKVPGCRNFPRGELDAVVARSASDVYAAGWCQYEGSLFGPQRGFIAHWDGGSWSLAYEAPVGQEITSLSVAPGGEIWAGGDNAPSGSSPQRGWLWHGSGTTWTRVGLPIAKGTGGIRAVAASSTLVYAAGSYASAGLTANYVMSFDPATGAARYEPISAIGAVSNLFVNALVAPTGGLPWLGGLADTASSSGAILARRHVPPPG